MRHLLKPVWYRWKAGVFRALAGMTWLATLAAYVGGVGPVALVMRGTGRRLLDRAPEVNEGGSLWRTPRRSSGAAADLDKSQRPF